MSKATKNDITDEGFRPAQFGVPASGADWTSYLDTLIAQAGRWAASRVGAAVYASVPADSYACDCIQRAEVCYIKSILFRRRVAFLDSSGSIGGSARDVQYLDRREMLAHADAALQCAEDNIAEAARLTGGDPYAAFGGASFGHIETGPYAIAIAGAING